MTSEFWMRKVLSLVKSRLRERSNQDLVYVTVSCG